MESLRLPQLSTKKPPGESWTQEGFASAALPRWTNVSCFNATKIWLLMIKEAMYKSMYVPMTSAIYLSWWTKRMNQKDGRHGKRFLWHVLKRFLQRGKTFFPPKPLTWTTDTRGRVGWQGSMSGKHIIFEPTPTFWLNPMHGIRIKHPNPQGTQ